jgi:hypothetical protein
LVVAFCVSEGYSASLRFKRQLVPREFQNINIENYLKNERAVRFQLKCIIDDGPCDRIGKYLKVTIPELLVNQCANCDMAQRERAGKLVSHIQQNFPEEWERAVKKFQVSSGGLVAPEDAARLESVLGVKLDPKLVGATSTTAAPSTTPVAKPAEVPSTSPVPVSTSAAPAASSSSEAPAATSSAAPVASSSSVAPVETSSVAAAVSEASTTVAAAAPSSTTAAAVSSSTSEATSTAAAVSSSSAAPAA